MLIVVFGVWRRGLTPAHQPNGFGWFMISMMILMVVMLIVRFIRPSVLVLGPKGLSSTDQWGRSRSVAWDDLEEVGIIPANRTLGRRLGLKYKLGRAPMPKASQINRAMVGYDTTIQDVWNMPLEKLADEFRQRIGSSKSAA